MSGCVQSMNTICKHVNSVLTYYANLLPLLSGSETISSITSITPVDSALTVVSSAVLSAITTVTQTTIDAQGNETTVTQTIAANKGISLKLSGGSTGAGCSVINVLFVKSTGESDSVDLRIEVHGVDV
jgi:hypothetical protein